MQRFSNVSLSVSWKEALNLEHLLKETFWKRFWYYYLFPDGRFVPRRLDGSGLWASGICGNSCCLPAAQPARDGPCARQYDQHNSLLDLPRTPRPADHWYSDLALPVVGY